LNPGDCNSIDFYAQEVKTYKFHIQTFLEDGSYDYSDLITVSFVCGKEKMIAS